MPKLPEVETSRKAISSHLINKFVQDSVLQHTQLRRKRPQGLLSDIKDKILFSIECHAKYLLFNFSIGPLSIHLGMSGNLRISPEITRPKKMTMQISFLPIFYFHERQVFIEAKEIGGYFTMHSSSISCIVVVSKTKQKNNVK
jgi:formamidopyrimidine-DNA glycosylase